jgi:hypothetical protein
MTSSKDTNSTTLPPSRSLVSHSFASFLILLMFIHSRLQLLVTANVPSSLILSTLIIEGIRSSETSVLTKATQRHTPEDGILHSHHCETLKSYILLVNFHYCRGCVLIFPPYFMHYTSESTSA